jgi:hypothetical protein
LPNTTIFTTNELCAIIRECGISGVEEFCYSNLRISFHARKENGEENPHINQSPGQVTEIQNKFDDSIIQQDEQNLKEDELSLLRIEDPFAYEKLILQRELTGDD